MDISWGYPSQLFRLSNNLVLALTDSEHLGTATGANPLSRRLSILHSNALGILHFFLRAAFNAISFHVLAPFVVVFYESRLFLSQSQ